MEAWCILVTSSLAAVTRRRLTRRPTAMVSSPNSVAQIAKSEVPSHQPAMAPAGQR